MNLHLSIPLPELQQLPSPRLRGARPGVRGIVPVPAIKQLPSLRLRGKGLGANLPSPSGGGGGGHNAV